MRDHGRGGKQGVPSEVSQAIQKATEKGVIIPPPNEIISTHDMEKLPKTIILEDGPFTQNAEDVEDALVQEKKAAEAKSMHESLSNMHREEENEAMLSKMRKDLESKRAQEAGMVTTQAPETQNPATPEVATASPTQEEASQATQEVTTAQKVSTPPKEESGEEFQGYPIATPEEVKEGSSAAKGTETLDRQESVKSHEQRTREAQERLEKISAGVDSRAKNLGPKIEQFTKTLVEGYKELPTHKKLILAGGLFALASAGAAAGGAAGTAIATAAFTGSLAQRMLGAAGMYMTLDAVLERKAVAGGKDGRTEAEKLRHKVLVGTFAALVGSGTLGTAIHNVAEMTGIIEDSGTPKSETTKTSKIEAAKGDLSEGVRHNEQSIPEAPKTSISPEATIKLGDTLWKVLGSKLEESGKLAGLNEAQKAYVIDSLKDKLEAMQSMSPDKIRDLGISSRDVNALKVGETLNLSSILQDNELVEKAVYRATELNPEQIVNIQEAGAGSATSIPPEAGNFTGVPEIPPQAGDFTGTDGAPALTEEQKKYWGSWADPNDTAHTPEAIERAAAISASIDASVKSDMNEMFGKKGFLGIGRVEGMNSPHITHPETGFGNMRVETVLNSPSGPVNGVGTGVGMSNNEAHEKMLKYLGNIQEQTGVRPNSSETTLEYIKRAMGYQINTTGQEAVATPAPQPEISTRLGGFTEMTPEKYPHIEANGMKGDFTYSADGKVIGFTPGSTLERGQGIQNLNPDWRRIVATATGMVGVEENANKIIEGANNVKTYEKILEKLVTDGHGESAEAEYLRSQIKDTVSGLEQKYGDIFKPLPGIESIPSQAPEIPPQAGNFTGETQVSPETQQAPKAEQVAESGLNTIQDKGLRSQFIYTSSGELRGLNTLNLTEGAGKELLNKDWANTARNHVPASLQTHATQMVSASAMKVSGLENLLKTLELKGFGDTEEAKFVKGAIEREITRVEKEYGDVFKNK